MASARPGTEPFPLSPKRLLIFGGKGGVGKTTASAAAALSLARRHRGLRVLVVSIDPAHSLSDSFGEPLGPAKGGLCGEPNLDGMEIDPATRFDELKERYRAWIDDFFGGLEERSRWDIHFDRQAMGELISLAPPGIDEIVALSALAELLEEDAYRVIVLDTAPTGHLVRFLELPDAALAWVKALLRLLLKYRRAVRLEGVGSELVRLSKNIKKVAALLTDPRECEFVAIGIPEQMSLEETARLVEALGRVHVPLGAVLINSVVPEEAASCSLCASRRRAETLVIRSYRRRFHPASPLFLAPQQSSEIRGPQALENHFRQWRALASQRKGMLEKSR